MGKLHGSNFSVWSRIISMLIICWNINIFRRNIYFLGGYKLVKLKHISKEPRWYFYQIMILANTTSAANMSFCLEMPNVLNRLCYILLDMRWLPHISTCINTGVINKYEVVLMIYFSCTVYPKKYSHGFCFAVLCCGYTLTDFPISIRLTSLALWQSNDCPSGNKATLMNMDKYLMWIHYERLHNHNKAKHNKTVCKFLGIYCSYTKDGGPVRNVSPFTKFWYRPISLNDSWGTHPISYDMTANVWRHIGCAVIVCAKV